MFGQKNVAKWLQKQTHFGYTIILEYCKLRKKNFKILKVNTGFKLKEDDQYQLIMSFIKECRDLNYFRQIEFIDLFQKPESATEKREQKCRIFEFMEDLHNKDVYQYEPDLVIWFY